MSHIVTLTLEGDDRRYLWQAPEDLVIYALDWHFRASNDQAIPSLPVHIALSRYINEGQIELASSMIKQENIISGVGAILETNGVAFSNHFVGPIRAQVAAGEFLLLSTPSTAWTQTFLTIYTVPRGTFLDTDLS